MGWADSIDWGKWLTAAAGALIQGKAAKEAAKANKKEHDYKNDELARRAAFEQQNISRIQNSPFAILSNAMLDKALHVYGQQSKGQGGFDLPIDALRAMMGFDDGDYRPGTYSQGWGNVDSVRGPQGEGMRPATMGVQADFGGPGGQRFQPTTHDSFGGPGEGFRKFMDGDEQAYRSFANATGPAGYGAGTGRLRQMWDNSQTARADAIMDDEIRFQSGLFVGGNGQPIFGPREFRPGAGGDAGGPGGPPEGHSPGRLAQARDLLVQKGFANIPEWAQNEVLWEAALDDRQTWWGRGLGNAAQGGLDVLRQLFTGGQNPVTSAVNYGYGQVDKNPYNVLLHYKGGPDDLWGNAQNAFGPGVEARNNSYNFFANYMNGILGGGGFPTLY